MKPFSINYDVTTVFLILSTLGTYDFEKVMCFAIYLKKYGTLRVLFKIKQSTLLICYALI